MAKKERPERRKRRRVALARGMLARFGTADTIMIDVTEAGARIEHFSQFFVGRSARFRFPWQNDSIDVQARVVSCRIHRFAHEAPGEGRGATVYQSGLAFTDYAGDSANLLRNMVAMLVARSLAEQVANARGIGPVIERNMPVFRAGVVASSGLESAADDRHAAIPDAAIVVERGYLRCTLIDNKWWDKKWSADPRQPPNGFTVPANESADQVEELCESYRKADAEGRALIQLLARISVEPQEETPEPI